jgi:hypothetical protein
MWERLLDDLGLAVEAAAFGPSCHICKLALLALVATAQGGLVFSAAWLALRPFKSMRRSVKVAATVVSYLCWTLLAFFILKDTFKGELLFVVSGFTSLIGSLVFLTLWLLVPASRQRAIASFGEFER